MNSKTLEYKGFQGSFECDFESSIMYGKILHINDLVTYESDTPKGLKEEFILAVDDYIETCKELGVEPDKPFSGSFNIRIGTTLHKDLAKFAVRNSKSINECVKDAIECHVNGRHSEIHYHHHEQGQQYSAESYIPMGRHSAKPTLRVLQ